MMAGPLQTRRTMPAPGRIDPMQAIRIIREEHQSLAAVLHGLLYVVRQIRAHESEPDFALLGAMVYYIDTFPERFHHPKEDAWLFRLLQLRHPDARDLIDRLQSEHRAGSVKLRELEQSLLRYQQGGRGEFRVFAAAVESLSRSSAITCAARKPKSFRWRRST
jgi:hemerythrin-like domain-containing protein